MDIEMVEVVYEAQYWVTIRLTPAAIAAIKAGEVKRYHITGVDAYLTPEKPEHRFWLYCDNEVAVREELENGNSSPILGVASKHHYNGPEYEDQPEYNESSGWKSPPRGEDGWRV